MRPCKSGAPYLYFNFNLSLCGDLNLSVEDLLVLLLLLQIVHVQDGLRHRMTGLRRVFHIRFAFFLMGSDCASASCT